MPELAEVEFYRKQWNGGIGRKILVVRLHPDKRIFRGTDSRALCELVSGTVLLESQAHGKQMLFRFSGGLWLGLHLGMTGRLRTENAGFKAAKHDHLVLVQARQTLVFTDPRQFGRVRFHRGKTAPGWWVKLPPPVTSRAFTAARMQSFLERHARLPIKAALLLQDGFPGIGNWMADEILWRSRLAPRTPAGRLNGEVPGRLWRTVRWVSRRALAIVGKDFSDPPHGWLFNERWAKGGLCPLHNAPLKRKTIGGRPTVWCGACQA
jgi:formamidopyrimidine-DNA glycosylase